jgi:nucleotidyltransferase substrate binding protein (TIGR01987 family)
MEERLELQIAQLKDAVENFKQSLELDISLYDEIAADSIKSGQVQKFEFCIVLFWKTLRRFILAQHGDEPKSPKRTVKRGFELELYSYATYETALAMIDWRNELSHIYKKDRFEAVRKKIIDTRHVWDAMLQALGGD